ncbi:MAG: GSCFA family protein [Ideonella sp. MAG2]|nr:MAG: GSCFA family protein [Ideonella sp. MAG2]
MVHQVISGEEAWRQQQANPQAKWPTRAAPERLSPLAEPATGPLFELTGQEKVFCIGSCFAREIEEALQRRGLDVLSLRREFPRSANRAVTDRNMFNKYNVGTILNELRWALSEPGTYRHEQVLMSAPGDLLVQDFQLKGQAYAEEWGLAVAFREAFNRFFATIAQADVVVLTLGLSEAWYDRHTQLYLNAAPTEHMVSVFPGRFELHVLDVASTSAMLDEIDAILKAHLQPGFKLLLTVSPVPLAATFRDQDVLVANSYSKSVLRACVDAFVHQRPHAYYFPSYEFVTLSHPDLVWRGDDFRHVDPQFVDYLMASVLSGLQGPRTAADPARAAARHKLLSTKLPEPPRWGSGVLTRWWHRLHKAWVQQRRQFVQTRKTLRGHLDRWDGQRLQGWAYDERHTRPVEVCLWVDDQPWVTTLADQERADVAKVFGPERLYSGFSVSLANLPAGGQTLTLRVGKTALKTIPLSAEAS